MTEYMNERRWTIQKKLILLQMILSPVIGLYFIWMRDWHTLAPSRVCNVTLDVLGMLILQILFSSVIQDRNDLALSTGCFAWLVSLNSLGLLFDLICWCVDEIPAMRIWNLLANTGFYEVGIATVLVFWCYLVELADTEDVRLVRFTKILNVAGLLTFLAVLGNMAGRYYFDVDAQGVYKRGRFYLSSQIFVFLVMIFSILLITKMDLTKRKRRALSGFVIAPMLMSVFQTCVYGLSLANVGILCALIVIYGNVFIERNRELVQQKLENMKKERELLLAKQEQQQVETELKLAADIQMHALPRIFPPFPDRCEFALHASMQPARKVGGDFFDFFLLDRSHLVLAIADVSGKGIPAALFMMTSKTLIRNAAQNGMSPAAILERVNQQLCENADDLEMFVTAWVGIYEIDTGRMIAANAGHEYPVIRRKGEDFAILKDKHGLVLGGMEDIRYREYELCLEPGDTLFLYTDGVPEAIDPDNRMYGTDGLLHALNQNPSENVETLIQSVRMDIDDFAGGRDPFDDITMLALRRAEAGE